MFCRDGKDGELSKQAPKMIYSPPSAVNKTSYKKWIQNNHACLLNWFFIERNDGKCNLPHPTKGHFCNSKRIVCGCLTSPNSHVFQSTSIKTLIRILQQKRHFFPYPRLACIAFTYSHTEGCIMQIQNLATFRAIWLHCSKPRTVCCVQQQNNKTEDQEQSFKFLSSSKLHIYTSLRSKRSGTKRTKYGPREGDFLVRAARKMGREQKCGRKGVGERKEAYKGTLARKTPSFWKTPTGFHGWVHWLIDNLEVNFVIELKSQ